jgi:hypothetical protein
LSGAGPHRAAPVRRFTGFTGFNWGARPGLPTITLERLRAVEELFAGFGRSFREQRAGVEVVVKLEAVLRRCDAPVWLLETLVPRPPATALRHRRGDARVAAG